MNIDYMIEVANKTIELLSDKNNWTRGSLARARDKFKQEAEPVHPQDPSANCFCLIGAIAKNSKLPKVLGYENWLKNQRSVVDGLYTIDEVLIFAEFLARHKKEEYVTTRQVYHLNDLAKSNMEIVEILKAFRDDLILQKSI